MATAYGVDVLTGSLLDLPDFVKGPFFCWYEGLSSPQCQEAHDLILETIEDEGPFDGVVGFSQGASLALSILLHDEINRPGQPPRFKFGVFLCSNLVISPDGQFNADAVHKYSRYYKKPESEPNQVTNGANGVGDDEVAEVPEMNGKSNGKPQKPKKPKSAPKHRALLVLPSQRVALVDELVNLVQDISRHTPGQTDGVSHAWKDNGTEDDFPRLFHPLTVKERVSIPTVHVIARADPLCRQGEIAVKLCEKKRTKVVQLNGGHRMPTTPVDLKAVASAIEWAIQHS